MQVNPPPGAPKSRTPRPESRDQRPQRPQRDQRPRNPSQSLAETSQRTRHLDTRYFKVRDYVRDQSIRVRHIGTDVNVSDFFTKALPRHSFQRYRDYLGMENHDRGGIG